MVAEGNPRCYHIRNMETRKVSRNRRAKHFGAVCLPPSRVPLPSTHSRKGIVFLFCPVVLLQRANGLYKYTSSGRIGEQRTLCSPTAQEMLLRRSHRPFAPIPAYDM